MPATPEEQAIDVESRLKQLAEKGLIGPNPTLGFAGGTSFTPPVESPQTGTATAPEPAKTRKQRSDAGKSKPKKPGPAPQRAGTLTAAQVATINANQKAADEAREVMDKAVEAWSEAVRKRSDYLDSLTKQEE